MLKMDEQLAIICRQTMGIYLNVFLAKDGLSIFFSQPNGPELKRCEDSSGYIHVVSVRGGPTKEPLGQQLACLNGHRSELLFALKHVSNSIDMRNIGLFIHSRNVTTPVEHDKNC